ncbi:MAG: DUF4369 domain-containing protein, partial [Bacteroidia bacterium]|nr:DUF4369 domain-containing protein [Bacteroidia bacterium]
MKRLLFLVLIVLIYSGCKEKNSITINGVIKGENTGNVYFHRLDLETPVLIDSSEISKKGTFRIKLKGNEPDFYQISLSAENFITLLA